MDEGDRFGNLLSEVRRILADGGPFTEIAPRILRLLCESLGWDVGIAWRHDDSAHRIHFVASWHDRSGPMTRLETMSERSTFSPGVGLPGRVVSTREPCWITDVQKDRGFPRSPAAMEDDFHSAFGFPLLHGFTVLGVMEFFSQERRELDEDLLIVVATLGPELGAVMATEQNASPGLG
jgi:signal transduction protein with GAF and PtsI domain